jgi:type I restriction enzyme S subunit
MGKIEELIKRLCHNGVPYIKLQEIAEIGTGNSDRKDAVENGDYPFYVRSKDILRIDKYEYDETAIIIPGEGGIGEIFHYVEGKYALHQRAYRIHIIDNKLNTKYLYYYMSSMFKKFIMKKAVSATVTSIRKPMIEQFPVPVPPLEVQCEIVHILDDFTLLSAELSAELKARQNQYNYYRDKEMLNAKNVVKYKLNEIAEIYDGTHQTPKYTDSGIDFISVENINDIYNSKKYISIDDYNKYKIKPKLNDIFMTRIGTIGKCTVFNKQKDLAYYVSLALIRPNNNIVDSYYLKYLIESIIGIKELRKRTLVNAVPIKINKDDIGKLVLPIPPLEEQKRIVNILDRFDKLCNNISEGLPAEIEARQKQYEYYRDKLLTFMEKQYV